MRNWNRFLVLLLAFAACSKDEAEKTDEPPRKTARGTRSLRDAAVAGVAKALEDRRDLADEPASLVPANAVVLVRVPPLDELRDKLSELGLPDLSGHIAKMAGLDLPAIRRDRPILIAASLEQGGSLTPTVIVPVEDPSRAAESARGPSTATAEGYLAVSQSAAYKAPEERAPLGKDGMPAGDVGVRVDLDRLVEVYRPMIHAVLQQTIGTVRENEAAAGLAEGVSEWAKQFVDGVQDLEIGLALNEGRFDARVGLTVKEGSPLDVGKAEGSLDELLKALPAQDFPMVYGFHGDMSKLMAWMGPLVQMAAQELPAEEREAFTAYFARIEEVYRLAGDRQVGAASFRGGLQAVVVLRPEKPEEFLRAMRQLMDSDYLAELGLKVSPSSQEEIAGVQVDVMKMDVEPEGTDAEAREAVQAMLGEEGLTMYLAAVEGYAVGAFGPRALMEKAVNTAKEGSGKLSGTAASALRDAGESSYFFHMDARDVARSVADAMARAGQPAPKVPEGRPVGFWLQGSQKARTWLFSLGVDVNGFKELVAAVDEPPMAPADEEEIPEDER